MVKLLLWFSPGFFFADIRDQADFCGLPTFLSDSLSKDEFLSVFETRISFNAMICIFLYFHRRHDLGLYLFG